MNRDPASLENLHDIVTPAPVSWWPPAPGWWALAAALLIAAGILGFRSWQTWRANTYRRVALGRLQRATTLGEIAEILKRAALAAYPRPEVAPLSGAAWLKWLQKTQNERATEPVEEALGQGVYAETNGRDVTQAAQFAENWVRRHRPGRTLEIQDET